MTKYSHIETKDLTWWRTIAQWMSVAILWVWLHTDYRIRVFNKEKLPRYGSGSYIYASNHQSNMDPPIMCVASFFRPISYMAKQELFENKIFALYCRLMGSFSVNREKFEVSTMRSAKAILKTGVWSLGMFPEGTRNQALNSDVREIKKGISFIALSAKVSVVPLGISRTGPKGKKITVVIGDPIPPEGNAETLGERIQIEMAKLTEEAYAKADL